MRKILFYTFYFNYKNQNFFEGDLAIKKSSKMQLTITRTISTPLMILMPRKRPRAPPEIFTTILDPYSTLWCFFLRERPQVRFTELPLNSRLKLSSRVFGARERRGQTSVQSKLSFVMSVIFRGCWRSGINWFELKIETI